MRLDDFDPNDINVGDQRGSGGGFGGGGGFPDDLDDDVPF